MKTKYLLFIVPFLLSACVQGTPKPQEILNFNSSQDGKNILKPIIFIDGFNPTNQMLIDSTTY